MNIWQLQLQLQLQLQFVFEMCQSCFCVIAPIQKGSYHLLTIY